MATSDVELGAGDNIGHTVQFLLECKEKGRDLSNQRRPTIFRAPSAYRDLSPRSFNPRMVSIGPLHRQDKNLQNFEAQKLTYLHHLLDLSESNAEKTLKECVQKVRMKIKEIKSCYEDSTNYNDEELSRMMVIDGCFILYFVHLISGVGTFQGNLSIFQLILNDVVMIENQIPFFVLKDIFESTFHLLKPNTSLADHLKILLLIYSFFKEYKVRDSVKQDTTHDHILGFLHTCLEPVNHPSPSFEFPKRHSAMELDRAGLNFRPNDDVNWAMAMKLELLPRFSCVPWFWSKLTLRMPKMYVDDDTEVISRNLIIYEQRSLVPAYVTSYFWAMDMLVDTSEDVAKLIKSGVLVNNCASNKKVANMINSISQDVPTYGFYYGQQWQDMDTHYNRYWPNAVAGLKRTYFSSPWNMIALCAAIVLFVLTLVQTIFTIKPQIP